MNELFNELRNELQTKKNWTNNEITAKVFNVRDKLKSELDKNGQISAPILPRCSTVDKLKKYDIVYMKTFGTTHYILVYKVKDNKVYGVAITSNEKATIHKIGRDRIFHDNYIGKSIVEYDHNEAKENFVRIYEDKREADAIFRQLKFYHKTIFNL